MHALNLDPTRPVHVAVIPSGYDTHPARVLAYQPGASIPATPGTIGAEAAHALTTDRTGTALLDYLTRWVLTPAAAAVLDRFTVTTDGPGRFTLTPSTR